MRVAAPLACPATFAFVLLSAVPVGAADPAEAPFGFHWGDPVASLPRPSQTINAGNVATLLYGSDTVPPVLRDTEEVTLKVCGRRGLQQVEWIGRPLPDGEARQRFAALYAEGVRLYGEADAGDPAEGTASWGAGRVTMVVQLAEPGLYRIVMLSEGPEFETCSTQ